MMPTDAHVYICINNVSLCIHNYHTHNCVLALLNSLPIIRSSLLMKDTYSQLNINCTPHVVYKRT